MPEPAFVTKFYLIVNPGLEGLALSELKAALPHSLNFKKDVGGIEFESEIHAGLRLNSILKIPSRILLRVDDFKASDFPKLYKKLLKISWKDLITEKTPLRFEVSSQTSRLAIKKRIESTAIEAVEKYFRTLKKEKAVKDESKVLEQRIFLRFVDDICTVSIDTSGEHLHKRGYRKLIGEAPLRENLAAALLDALFSYSNEIVDCELVDPMVGSGTFLLEAYHDFTGSELRHYAYQAWPYIKKTNETVPLATQSSPKLAGIFKVKKLRGFDEDPDSIRISQENFESLKAGAKSGAAPVVEFSKKNIFTDQLPLAEFASIVISNPPYGKRIKVEGKISAFYSQFFAECERKLKPRLAGFLITDEVPEAEIKCPSSWRQIHEIKFRNGGLKVRFVIFQSS